MKKLVPGGFSILLILLTACSGDEGSSQVKFETGQETTFGLSIRTDLMQAMVSLDDQSFVCAGWSDNENTAADATNILVTKFDKDLKLVCNKLLGGGKSDLASEIIQTKDGGFLLTCSTNSSDGDFTNNKGLNDLGIIKLNSQGDKQWAMTYGGSAHDGVNSSSVLALDNGYALLGYSASENAGIQGKMGSSSDIWLLELDNNGNINNSRAIGSTGDDYAYSLLKSVGGYVVLSKIGAASKDFDKPGIWIFETNAQGDIGWKTFIDGLNAGKLIHAGDGGYIAVSSRRVNVADLLVTKLANTGKVEWEQTYARADQEYAEDIIETESGYIILGTSRKNITAPEINAVYVGKLNKTGQLTESITIDTKVTAARIFQTGAHSYTVGGTKDVASSSAYIDSEFWLQHLKGPQ